MPLERIDPPVLSLVIPLYNESEVFAQLEARLHEMIQKFGRPVEVILVDDGSHDGTPGLIEAACLANPEFRGVLLSRNFGHQLAITAGLTYTKGEMVAILDGDLQDPPEVVIDFVKKIQEGWDVVYAIRQHRKENIFKRMAYAAFYRLLRMLATIPIPVDSGDFCVMRRHVVQLINTMPERHRFVRGIRSWVGFRQTGVAYSRSARAGGEPKYTFSKLLKLALDGIFTFSEIPLRLSMYFGLGVSFLAFCWSAYIITWRILHLHSGELPGFATLASGILFLGGIQLVAIGILGEYIGRIHNEVKHRPLFVVDKLIGIEAEKYKVSAIGINE